MPVQLSRELLARFGREPTTLLALAGLGAQEPQAVDTTDGLRLTARSGEIVHLRPSGNAPELRCSSEADKPERARKLVEEVRRSEERRGGHECVTKWGCGGSANIETKKARIK